MIRPSGWNTWDVKALNAIVCLPEGIEVRFCLYDGDIEHYISECGWEYLSYLGPHASDGSYCAIDLKYRNSVFTFEYASSGKNLACKITPRKRGPEDLVLVVEVFSAFGKKDEIVLEGKTIVARKESLRFVFGSPNNLLRLSSVPSKHSFLSFPLKEESVYFSCGLKIDQTLLDEFIQDRKSEYLGQQPKGKGILGKYIGEIGKAITWNTIWDPRKKEMITVLDRSWAKRAGGYACGCQDTFYQALLASVEDKELAYQNIRFILAEQVEQGFVPNYVSGEGNATDRSQPPIGSYCVLEVYKKFGEIELLRDTFSPLLKWHRWWFKARDGNKDGLLEWGSDPTEGALGLTGTLQGAKYEAGMDNSPMYDDAVFNQKSHTMQLTDVGLNAIYALDTLSLAEMAKVLKETSWEDKLREEYRNLKKRINRSLWDEKTGMYLNKDWQGNFSCRLSPTLFYPLLAGVPDSGRAERMVREHLLNRQEFWGKYVLPSISKNDPAYGDNSYWRGRIWPPMNFLVYEGLKRYGYDNEARRLVLKSIKLFSQEWENESHIHENYNAETGEGDDTNRVSDPFNNSKPCYTWGALLPYLGYRELEEAKRK